MDSRLDFSPMVQIQSCDAQLNRFMEFVQANLHIVSQSWWWFCGINRRMKLRARLQNIRDLTRKVLKNL